MNVPDVSSMMFSFFKFCSNKIDVTSAASAANFAWGSSLASALTLMPKARRQHELDWIISFNCFVATNDVDVMLAFSSSAFNRFWSDSWIDLKSSYEQK